MALALTEYAVEPTRVPTRSDSCRLAFGLVASEALPTPRRSSRCAFLTVFFRTMWIVPAIDWVETSALAAGRISMRSMTSGESWPIEKPAGARSPLTSTRWILSGRGCAFVVGAGSVAAGSGWSERMRGVRRGRVRWRRGGA